MPSSPFDDATSYDAATYTSLSFVASPLARLGVALAVVAAAALSWALPVSSAARGGGARGVAAERAQWRAERERAVDDAVRRWAAAGERQELEGRR